MDDLWQSSIEIILSHQAPSGAYIASPNFPTYRYCWLRDGSYIAHAMDQAGEYASARAYFLWVDRAIRRYAWKVDRVLEKVGRGEQLHDSEFLHTRYNLAGEEARDRWGNFQLDGYGTWLWALSEHVNRANDLALLEEVAASVQTTVRYLSALWKQPNYDCWEENPQYIHPYTLAAIYAGLRAVQQMSVCSGSIVLAGMNPDLPETIRQFVLAYGVQAKYPMGNGFLVKSFLPPEKKRSAAHIPPGGVDASLVGLCTPYGLLADDHPVMRATTEQIERDLHRKRGGVYRYQEDTYFGGGEWVLLAGWLGWHHARNGKVEFAIKLLRWIETQADAEGNLPEQVSTHLLAPEYFSIWKDRWGPVANPLLWSHAMYLILHQEIHNKRNQ